MKVLITGASGQLGRELQSTKPDHIELIAMTSAELDITDSKKVHSVINSHEPDVIINAAAYTPVDQAEEHSAAAYAVNAEGVKNILQVADAIHARLIHISTDFVFDGEKSSPYKTSDSKNPLSVYGKSKREGEDAVLNAQNGHVIIRTAWLYATAGQNFVNTILRLCQEKQALNIISDQVGTPTWTRTLADAIWKVIGDSKLQGIYHITDNGIASWYDFAVAIAEEARDLGLIENVPVIHPIKSDDYPQLAKRPSYSVLDKSSSCKALDFYPMHWRESLIKMLREKKNG